MASATSNKDSGVDDVAIKEEDDDGYVSEASTIGMANSEDQDDDAVLSQSAVIKEEDEDGYLSVASTVGMANSEDESEDYGDRGCATRTPGP